jgi:hypothetical protein
MGSLLASRRTVESSSMPNSSAYLVEVLGKVSDQRDGVGVGQEWMP